MSAAVVGGELVEVGGSEVGAMEDVTGGAVVAVGGVLVVGRGGGAGRRDVGLGGLEVVRVGSALAGGAAMTGPQPSSPAHERGVTPGCSAQPSIHPVTGAAAMSRPTSA